ncbi:ferric reductase-like transmembrane domain-containing protein [Candidatus Accumulibacter sp. ACC003]|uniref:ferric reductase-like transmembrane domain-containing protein n=1 Tax=Candidatus Accumulibacter sp. ACC003 TaxID=2823334 RepID=UPI0025C6E700|nr:ferric reductase-like transmembrane domain-containing protein [Candidatus Accumulibacter sp. ACC003]
MTAAATSVSAIRRAVAPLAALSITLAAVVWAFPGGLTPWRSVGIVSGWAASGLLVASLLLMVRQAHLAKLLGGLELSYRWHHRCGLVAYLLLLGHPLALALDGWAEAPQLAWQTLDPGAQSWPLWLGWGGLLLLMLGLTTTFAVHLPYRRWRAFHFVLGAGALLGLTHIYVLLGNDPMFLALLTLAMAALAWRLLASDLGLSAHPYRVTQVDTAAADTIEASLAPCASALVVTPGQFVLAAFADGVHYRGCGEYHPFTVSASDHAGRLRITVKALGPCSRRIQALEPGVLVRLEGPFGNFLDALQTAPQLWVAGGIGITPFIARLRAERCQQPTTLIYLYRQRSDAAFVDELHELANEDRLFELLDEASGDDQPDLARVLERVSGLADRQVQMCGPPALLAAITPALRQRGVADQAIHCESFDFR